MEDCLKQETFVLRMVLAPNLFCSSAVCGGCPKWREHAFNSLEQANGEGLALGNDGLQATKAYTGTEERGAHSF